MHVPGPHKETIIDRMAIELVCHFNCQDCRSTGSATSYSLQCDLQRAALVCRDVRRRLQRGTNSPMANREHARIGAGAECAYN